MNHISPIIHIIDSCIKPVFLRTAIDGYIMLMAELIAVKVFLRLLQTVYIPQFIDFSQSFCLSHISFPCLHHQPGHFTHIANGLRTGTVRILVIQI